MLAEESYIQDAQFDSSIGSKILLAEKIIESFTPMFSEEIDRKREILREARQDYIRLKESVSQAAATLDESEVNLSREKSIKKILDDMETLLNHDVLYGKNKSVVRQMLQKLESSNGVDLEKYSVLLQKIIKQNIKKVIT